MTIEQAAKTMRCEVGARHGVGRRETAGAVTELFCCVDLGDLDLSLAGFETLPSPRPKIYARREGWAATYLLLPVRLEQESGLQ